MGGFWSPYTGLHRTQIGIPTANRECRHTSTRASIITNVRSSFTPVLHAVSTDPCHRCTCSLPPPSNPQLSERYGHLSISTRPPPAALQPEPRILEERSILRLPIGGNLFTCFHLRDPLPAKLARDFELIHVNYRTISNVTLPRVAMSRVTQRKD